MATAKQIAREVLDSLPDDCSLEDIQYQLYVRARIEEGIRQANQGQLVPHEQVLAEARECLKR